MDRLSTVCAAAQLWQHVHTGVLEFCGTFHDDSFLSVLEQTWLESLRDRTGLCTFPDHLADLGEINRRIKACDWGLMTTSSVPSALRLKAYEFSAAFIEQEAHVDSLSIDLKKCPVDNSLLRPPSTSDYCTYDTPSLEAFTDTNPNEKWQRAHSFGIRCKLCDQRSLPAFLKAVLDDHGLSFGPDSEVVQSICDVNCKLQGRYTDFNLRREHRFHTARAFAMFQGTAHLLFNCSVRFPFYWADV
mmetsp:Transcript_27985/g.86564  ORF Transcript_27985/g.86564 Transcript_27985/m.86564 type:complete len:244 (-) Transcript_27985:550-1281(-)